LNYLPRYHLDSSRIAATTRSASRPSPGLPRPSSGPRCNGLARASLLTNGMLLSKGFGRPPGHAPSHPLSLAMLLRATFGGGPLRRLSAGGRSFSVSAQADVLYPHAYSSRMDRCSIVYSIPVFGRAVKPFFTAIAESGAVHGRRSAAPKCIAPTPSSMINIGATHARATKASSE